MKLKETELEFRELIWNNKPINNILLVSELASDNEKNPKSITVSINKKQLATTYIYYDFKTIVLDGGFYYTYDLSKYPILNDSK